MKTDLGLLVLRVGAGGMMAALHGWGKISDPSRWAGLGEKMSYFGISFGAPFWGFMAAFSEFGASLLIMVGFFFRPATALLGFTMFTAALVHLNMEAGAPNAGIKGASHALLYLVICSALFLTGPGKYALVIKKAQND